MALENEFYEKNKALVIEAVDQIGTKKILGDILDYVVEVSDISYAEAKAVVEHMKSDGSWAAL